MNGFLFKLFLRDWKYFKAHWIAAALGIAIAVAIVTAVQSAILKTQRAVDVTHNGLSTGVIARVEGARPWLPEALYVRALVDFGVTNLVPIVEGWVEVGPEKQRVLLLGQDAARMLNSNSDRSKPVVDQSTWLRLISEPGAVIIGTTLAHTLSVDRDQSIVVGNRETEHLAHIVAVLDADMTNSNPLLENIIFGDIGTVQRILGMEGVISYFNVHEATAREQSQLENFLAENSQNLVLGEGQQRQIEASNLPNAFYGNLTLIGWLALLLGAMIAANAALYVVRFRREMVGTLRAIGVSRTQVFLLQAASFVAVSLLGSVVGIVAGSLLSDALYVLTLRTVNELFTSSAWIEQTISTSILAKSLGVGVGAGLVGALVSGWQACNIAPTTLMRERVGKHRRSYGVWLLGVVTMSASAYFLLLGHPDYTSVHWALFALLGGYTLIAPQAVTTISKLVCRLFRNVLSPLSMWGLRNVPRLQHVYGLAVASVVVAVSAAMALHIMVGSFRGAVEEWIDRGFSADYFVSLPSDRPTAGFSSDDIASVRRLPGVIRVQTSRSATVELDDTKVTLYGREDFSEMGNHFRILKRMPSLLLDENAVVITEALANNYRLKLADIFEVERDARKHKLIVAAVVADFSTGRGYLMSALSTFERIAPSEPVSAMTVYGEPSLPSMLTLDALQSVLSHSTGLRIRDNRYIREVTLRVFDRTFEIVGVLSFVVVATSFLGIVIALFTAQSEKRPDYKILTMMGVTRWEIGKLVYFEVTMLSIIACVVALPLAYILAYFFCNDLMRLSFGWTFPINFDGGALAKVVGVTLVSTFAASAILARYAARVGLSKGYAIAAR